MCRVLRMLQRSIRDSELMSRGFGNILQEQTPTERDGDGSPNETL